MTDQPRRPKVSKEALKVAALLDQVISTFEVAERNNEDPWEALGVAHLSDEERAERLGKLLETADRVLSALRNPRDKQGE